MTAIQARALAKINLHLAVHGRRADGYHELTTVFQSIALHDTLTVEAWDGPFVLACREPGVPTDSTNLVWRAAEACREVLGRPALTGLRVTLDKETPAQSGLGGGSADAVAMLRALARLWGVTLDDTFLSTVARRLGADVPYFVIGGTALGIGRGDLVSPLADLPDHTVLILRPSFGVGTADAYRWVAEARAGAGHTHAGGGERQPSGWPETSGEWPARLGECRNDFEPVVAARFPVVGDLTAALRARGASLAVLSGSGSAVVGLFDNPSTAETARLAFDGRPGLGLRVSRTVSRDEYLAEVAPVAIAS